MEYSGAGGAGLRAAFGLGEWPDMIDRFLSIGADAGFE